MEVLRLNADDCRLLAARFGENGNSHRRMAAALSEAGADELLERLRALRRLERHFGIDLGSLCHRHLRREEPGTHPIERMVLNHVADWRSVGDDDELWVYVDRVRQVRDWIEPEQRVRERET